MIVFDHVSKKYGAITALSDISFKIDEGEFVFLTGPSGAGKTTIIKLLLREIVPTSGVVRIGTIDIGKLSAKKIPILRRRLGVVFQDFKLLPDRTVFENIAISLQILAMPVSQINKEVTQILELTKLADRSHLFPSQLAGGEIQRAVIARAIVGKPDLLLADEPTGNLDPKTSDQIINLLSDINAQGTTILMSTHNSHIVDNLSKRVMTMKDGTLIRDERQGKYHPSK